MGIEFLFGVFGVGPSYLGVAHCLPGKTYCRSFMFSTALRKPRVAFRTGCTHLSLYPDKRKVSMAIEKSDHFGNDDDGSFSKKM